MVKIILIMSVIACVISVMIISKTDISSRGSYGQRFTYSDSLFIAYTVKEYSRQDWYWFRNYERMYQIKNEQIAFFVERVFYSPDKKRLVTWVGRKMFNAPTIEKYDKDDMTNRICPLGGDTVFHMNVLIGYKDNEGLWKLYPWGNRQVPCCRTKEIGVKELEQYYFEDIKEDYLEVVEQDNSKGIIKNQLYKYAINEDDFWKRSPVWQKDNVGANNKYPFEIKYNRITERCIKCAEVIKLPLIDYPDSIKPADKWR